MLACAVCRVEFRRNTRSKNAGLCCSRACGFQLLRQRGEAKRRQTEARARDVKAARTVQCQECGASFPYAGANRYCSEECRLRASRLRARAISRSRIKPSTCEQCGTEFVKAYGSLHVRVWKRWCCSDCRDAHVLKRKQITDSRRYAVMFKGRIGSLHVRRAQFYGVPYELGVTRARVFKRDGWVCQICKRDTLRGKLSRTGPRDGRLPELDHIIPLSKGGSHTCANVQTLCRRCNNEKGDAIESASETLTRVDAEVAA